MPLGDGITGSVAYDFGGRHSAASVTASRTLLSSGRPLDLGIRWSEKGNALSLDATTRPHPNHKIFASVNPRTGAALGSWFADVSVPLPERLGGRKPLSLGVARDFARSSTSFSAARSIAGAKVGATYALEEGVATLAVGKAPLKAAVKAKRQPAAAGGLGGSSSPSAAAAWGRPSVSLSIDRELQFDTPWGSKPVAAPKPALPATKGGNPLTDSALFRRLGEIDSLWKGGAGKAKKVEAAPPAVKSWSFLRKRAAA